MSEREVPPVLGENHMRSSQISPLSLQDGCQGVATIRSRGAKSITADDIQATTAPIPAITSHRVWLLSLSLPASGVAPGQPTLVTVG